MSETKGITVKVPIELHAEVSARLAETGKTMSEFVAEALKDKLHPKNQIMEEKGMENKRTVAFQVSEELFDRLEDFLKRTHQKKNKFMIGLIEKELEREQAQIAENSRENEQGEEVDEAEEESQNNGVSGGETSKEEESEEIEEEAQGGPVMGGM